MNRFTLILVFFSWVDGFLPARRREDPPVHRRGRQLMNGCA